MHGEYLLVASVDTSRQTIVVAGSSFPFGKDDTLVFYGHDTQYKGTADIADLHSVQQPDSTAGRQTTAMGDFQGFQSYDDLDFLEVGALQILVTLPLHDCNMPQLPRWLADDQYTDQPVDMRPAELLLCICSTGHTPLCAHGGLPTAYAVAVFAVYPCASARDIMALP